MSSHIWTKSAASSVAALPPGGGWQWRNVCLHYFSYFILFFSLDGGLCGSLELCFSFLGQTWANWWWTSGFAFVHEDGPAVKLAVPAVTHPRVVAWLTLGQHANVRPPGPDLSARWWEPRACVVAPCVTLSYAGLCDPQEEDSAPPRPPLPQSYEPIPPTVPPLPSRANIRPSSLYRPEERKVSSRNGTASVSSLTHGPLGRPTVLSSCHCLLWWFLLSFRWTSHLCWIYLCSISSLNWCHSSSVLWGFTFFSPPIFLNIEILSVLFLLCYFLGCNNWWFNLSWTHTHTNFTTVWNFFPGWTLFPFSRVQTTGCIRVNQSSPQWQKWMKTTEKTELNTHRKLPQTKVHSCRIQGPLKRWCLSAGFANIFWLSCVFRLRLFDLLCNILVLFLNQYLFIFTCQGRPTQSASSHPELNLQCLNRLP